MLFLDRHRFTSLIHLNTFIPQEAHRSSYAHDTRPTFQPDYYEQDARQQFQPSFQQAYQTPPGASPSHHDAYQHNRFEHGTYQSYTPSPPPPPTPQAASTADARLARAGLSAGAGTFRTNLTPAARSSGGAAHVAPSSTSIPSQATSRVFPHQTASSPATPHVPVPGSVNPAYAHLPFHPKHRYPGPTPTLRPTVAKLNAFAPPGHPANFGGLHAPRGGSGGAGVGQPHKALPPHLSGGQANGRQ